MSETLGYIPFPTGEAPEPHRQAATPAGVEGEQERALRQDFWDDPANQVRDVNYQPPATPAQERPRHSHVMTTDGAMTVARWLELRDADPDRY